MKAMPTCIDGRWLKIDGLTFETKFNEPVMDFAVSWMLNRSGLVEEWMTELHFFF